jgi:hypothetical protein
MSLKKKFQKSLEQQWRLRFKTNHPDGTTFDGVVTHVKPRFIVMREDNDFRFDGVVILPKRSITGYRDGKYERCANDLMRENGEMAKCVVPAWLDATETLSGVIDELARRDIWPTVETLYQKGTKSAFYIGPITRLAKKRFNLYQYDSAGKWERDYEISYQEVFRIEFDNHYSNAFNDYMRARTINKPPLAEHWSPNVQPGPPAE